MEDATHPPFILDMQTGLMLKQIIQGQLVEIQTQTPIALEGIDIEGVHKLRVAYRRLRTSLKIFKPLIKRNTYHYFQTNTNGVRQLLGDIRDLDVLNENFETNETIQGNAKALAFWQQKINPTYQTYRNEFATQITSSQYATFLSYLESFSVEPISGLKTNPKLPVTASTIQGFAPFFLTKSLETILTSSPDFQNPQPYSTYHQLRKALKQFRYALEFFSPYLNPTQTNTFIESLITLQDHLGLLNDSVVATRVIEINFPEIFLSLGSNEEKTIRTYYLTRSQEKDQLTQSFLDIWGNFQKNQPAQLLSYCFPT